MVKLNKNITFYYLKIIVIVGVVVAVAIVHEYQNCYNLEFIFTICKNDLLLLLLII